MYPSTKSFRTLSAKSATAVLANAGSGFRHVKPAQRPHRALAKVAGQACLQQVLRRHGVQDVLGPLPLVLCSPAIARHVGQEKHDRMQNARVLSPRLVHGLEAVGCEREVPHHVPQISALVASMSEDDSLTFLEASLQSVGELYLSQQSVLAEQPLVLCAEPV